MSRRNGLKGGSSQWTDGTMNTCVAALGAAPGIAVANTVIRKKFGQLSSDKAHKSLFGQLKSSDRGPQGKVPSYAMYDCPVLSLVRTVLSSDNSDCPNCPNFFYVRTFPDLQ